MLEKYT